MCETNSDLIRETWKDLPQFSILKKFLGKIRSSFVKSPARKRRYLNHLRMNGINSPRKIPLPNQTRWNSWFEMVFYTKEHIQYWQDFFKREYEKDSQNETIIFIHTILQNPNEIGIIIIYVNFISIYAKKFVQDFDFFQQQNKQVFPFC